ncbi:MAG: DNA mismatch repair endonuclease MutL [Polyangiaceae bacterium]|jgi:DNA mismatch repair protein MutL
MGRIRRLPSDLANQIAAGEVVERPASIVKELVENALDASATRIHVDLEQGGVGLVRVSDDGSGMDADDAQLAMERHATSKIQSSEDLFRLQSYGFRGEALPSIASVAKLRLVTRVPAQNEGTEVLVEGGGPLTTRPVGTRPGTSVEVRELFFNVPARRKFMKSIGTETAHVTDALLVAALARPDVSFFLSRDGRSAKEWLRVGSRRERAAQAFYGEALASVHGERGPLLIEAHLSPPERARAGAAGLYLLVNGRPVRDRALARAIAQAYGSVLEAGRYPVGVVYVELPPDQIDVNVHPQKSEVRFAEARAVFDATTRELRAGLARAFGTPPLPSRPPGSAAPLSLSPSLTNGNDPWREFARCAPAQADTLAEPVLGSLLELEPSAAPPAPAQAPTLFETPGFFSSLEFLAQVRATFLVCAGPDGLYILDQHAAAERVTFDRLSRARASRSIPMQRVLIPEIVELSSTEVSTLDEQADNVTLLGIELRAVGPTAVAVHGIPALLTRTTPDRLVRDLVAELAREAKRPFGDSVDLVLATMACHGSVRAGDPVSREEAIALLQALDDVDFRGHCPHGRPVVTRIGYDDLERRVGR